MLSLWQLTILISATIIGLTLAYVNHLPLAVGFLLGLSTLIYQTSKMGTDKATIIKAMKSGVVQMKEVVYILTLIGILIPAWTASGTIPYMIHWGLNWINPTYFLTGSFIITAIVSMLLGTCLGSLSAIGIPLFGVGALMHVSIPALAGALVSGAVVGDRTSPVSSANHLVAAATGVSIKKQANAILPTTIGALLISTLFFLALDLMGQWDVAKGVTLDYSFDQWFNFHLSLLIPPVLLMAGIVLRFKTINAFLMSIISSLLIGSIYQYIAIGQWLCHLVFGFNGTNISVLHNKGLLNMIQLVVLIVLTGAFNGILEETRVIEPYIRNILGKSASLLSATLRTSIFGVILNLIACNQALPIVISGRNLKPIWAERFPVSQLSRVIADSHVVYAAMVPWNMMAIMSSAILGVSVSDYVPFAIFLWILPLLTIAFSGYQTATNKAKVSKSTAI
ncbi:Na+/H+ antiporter NhaC family protein [Peptococcaceae bacterium 1198_IL3148]